MCLNSHVFGKPWMWASVLVQVPARVLYRVDRVEMAMLPGPLVAGLGRIPDASLHMGNDGPAARMHGQAALGAAAA